jgi:hypothetical protein
MRSIYPQPNGEITVALRRKSCDYSPLTLWEQTWWAKSGIEADSDKAIFPAVNLEVAIDTTRP